MGKVVKTDHSGNAVKGLVLRARYSDWRLTRERTPMVASGERRATRPDIRAQLTGPFVNADRRFTKEPWPSARRAIETSSVPPRRYGRDGSSAPDRRVAA